MANYEIGATFYNSPETTVETALRKAFGEVQTKSRLFGCRMDFQSNCLTLHVQTVDNNGERWFLNAVFNGTTTELEQLLDQFTRSLIEADILYLIDYVELDEKGEPVSDEETLSHPEFKERYMAPK